MKTRLLILVALLALAVPGTAWAHATLVRTIPANGRVLAHPPLEARAVFDDVVRVGPGVAAIRNGGGSILRGRPHVEGERTLVIPLRRNLAKGVYSVRWSVISDDGHLESGVFAFAVGIGSPPPTAALAPGANEPRPASVVSRWILFVGLLAAVGTAVFALVARPRDEERIALVLASSAVVAALGAAEEVHRVGLDTRAGTALGAGFLAAVAVALLAGGATMAPRLLRPAVVLALGLAAVPSVSGHALDRGLNRVNVAADILHVAGAAAWVGALVGLVVFRDASRRRAVQLAAGGVLVLGATGVVRAWFELVRVSQLWDTSYGRSLLVKTGCLLGVLAVGWALRARIRIRAGAELLLVAGLLVAVSVLVLQRPGRNIEAAVVKRVEAAEPAPAPPAPPTGAVVLAQEAGPLGVALELEQERTTAIVLSPAGGGLSGLDVRVGGKTAQPCGYGCYRVDARPDAPLEVEIDGFGPTLKATFDVPRSTRPAGELLRRASARYRALGSVFYLERLQSTPSRVLTALWRLERPDRIWYAIPGGAQGIVIGKRRWDRESPDGTWRESAQTPLVQPAPAWETPTNAHVIEDTGETKTVSFADPATPAFFEVTLDAHTLLPRVVRMTAAAHFMVDRYVRFNAPRQIAPPR